MVTTATSKLVVPVVHLGGTSRNELIDRLQDAAKAAREAASAVNDTQPHPRDFPSDKAAYDKALTQHLHRWQRIKDVENELNDLMEAIHEQA